MTGQQQGGCMARRHDTDTILNELGEVRRVLDDPAIGLAAFHQDQDELRRKVLETVALGTTGLREENRELRRRQEKMLSDLADTRTSIEALRREIAQAQTVGAPLPATAAATVTSVGLAGREPRSLEAGSDSKGTNGWKEEAVHEMSATGPAEHGDGEKEEQQAEAPSTPSAPGEGAAAAPTEAELGKGTPPETQEQEQRTTSAPADGDEHRQADLHRHTDSLLSAASIASARLICHRDAWEFVIEQTGQHPHFRIPDRISDAGDGQVETFLSGRSLLAVLTTMRALYNDQSQDMATWALASAVYRRTQYAVAAATGTRSDGGEVTTIVLDDRPAPADTA
ncbi:hypothetical protein [Streptomyces sp. 8N706]|uniref:hypothetical protein n=1 Tax=Streptomyces sp. 8N706 TaxID=3457416 RepID=UPI003FD69B4E